MASKAKQNYGFKDIFTHLICSMLIQYELHQQHRNKICVYVKGLFLFNNLTEPFYLRTSSKV